jgi:hypothetical protein
MASFPSKISKTGRVVYSQRFCVFLLCCQTENLQARPLGPLGHKAPLECILVWTAVWIMRHDRVLNSGRLFRQVCQPLDQSGILVGLVCSTVPSLYLVVQYIISLLDKEGTCASLHQCPWLHFPSEAWEGSPDEQCAATSIELRSPMS